MRYVPLAVLVAGCDPCTGFVGPEFVDAENAFSDEQVGDLQRTYDQFMAWTASERVCIDEIAVAPVEDPPMNLWSNGFGRWEIRVDPASESPTRDLRWGLCAALDLRTDLSKDQPILFTDEDGFLDRRETFAEICADGPPWDGFAPSIEAACGRQEWTWLEDFLVHDVYGKSPGADVLGLAVSPDGPMWTVPDLDTAPYRGSRAVGSHLALLREVDSPRGPDRTLSATWLDLETGLTSAGPRATVGGFSWESGSLGGDALALVTNHGARGEVQVADPVTGEVHAWSADLDGLALAGTVSEGTLYLHSDWALGAEPMWAIGAGGTRREVVVPPPEPPQVALAGQLIPVEDGFVVRVSDALVYQQGDSASIGILDHHLYRYSLAEDAWEDLLPGQNFVPRGITGDGLIVGYFYWPGGPTLWAAWDVEAHALRVTDDVCDPGSFYGPVAGHGIWSSEESGTDVVFRSWDVHRE